MGQQRSKLAAECRIGAFCRLVQKQNVGTAAALTPARQRQKHRSKCGTLQLPAGEITRMAVEQRQQSAERENGGFLLRKANVGFAGGRIAARMNAGKGGAYRGFGQEQCGVLRQKPHTSGALYRSGIRSAHTGKN